MNWLTDYVKPKISSLVNRKEPPSDLWTKCGCGERTLYVSDLKENLNVCSYCDFHMGMDVNSRLKSIVESYYDIDVNVPLLLESKIGDNWLDVKDVV